tara:strand:+ start:258 stop:518 length:261 start_codon:yes stop_codon:yes gene_type:complete
MNIEEMQEILTDLQKQYKESSELTLKILGAIELTQKMMQQDAEKAEKEKIDNASSPDDLVDGETVIKSETLVDGEVVQAKDIPVNE